MSGDQTAQGLYFDRLSLELCDSIAFTVVSLVLDWWVLCRFAIFVLWELVFASYSSNIRVVLLFLLGVLFLPPRNTDTSPQLNHSGWYPWLSWLLLRSPTSRIRTRRWLVSWSRMSTTASWLTSNHTYFCAWDCVWWSKREYPVVEWVLRSSGHFGPWLRNHHKDSKGGEITKLEEVVLAEHLWKAKRDREKMKRDQKIQFVKDWKVNTMTCWWRVVWKMDCINLWVVSSCALQLQNRPPLYYRQSIRPMRHTWILIRIPYNLVMASWWTAMHLLLPLG